MEVQLSNRNFDQEVIRSPIPVIVDFWAQWCMPCHAIAPALSEIALEYEGRLKVGKLNVDQYPDIASGYQIRSIPNLKIFKNGGVVEEIVGAVPKKEIVKRLTKHI